jgi:hypothetical protein
MSCEHLICARCSNPVIEGRCPTCRIAREELHHKHGQAIPPAVVLTALVALFVLALFLRQWY